MAASTVSRRAALFGLAGAGLTACGVPWSPERRAAPSVAASGLIDLALSGMLPDGVVTAFERTHPHIHIDTGRSPARYQMETLLGAGMPGALADMTAALHALNFDPSVLVAGALATWTSRRRIVGIPISSEPLGMVWRPDAFAAAGITPPDTAWTYDDLHQACGALQTLAASGRIPGLIAPLAPIALTPRRSSGVGPRGAFLGPPGWYFPTALQELQGFWQAFVWGFTQDGRFALTGEQTVVACQTLVDLARVYCVPAEAISALPTNTTSTAWFTAIDSLFALQFEMYSAAPRPAPWRWARLPRFPRDPVIPTRSTALCLGSSRPGGVPPQPQAPETLAAAEFGVWLDAPAGLAATSPAGVPPAVASSPVQTAF